MKNLGYHPHFHHFPDPRAGEEDYISHFTIILIMVLAASSSSGGWLLPAYLKSLRGLPSPDCLDRWRQKLGDEFEYFSCYMEKLYFDFLCHIAEFINMLFRQHRY
jgi:hypothetical protein